MTFTQKSFFSDSQIRHNKSSKKSKGGKKVIPLVTKDPISSTVQEKVPVAKKSDSENESDDALGESVDLKNDLKKQQLEKRKQDVGEWKTLRKIDYQRLETVLEEGQLSSEESTSKPNSLGSTKKGKKESECNSGNDGEEDVSAGEESQTMTHTERTKSQDESLASETSNLEENSEKCVDGVGNCEDSATESESEEKFCSPKWDVMMEVLPIFSNDKFVCSRDAISIEEYEEYESAEKTSPVKTQPQVSEGNTEKKEVIWSENTGEKAKKCAGDLKEINERKLRYKMLTDKSLSQQSSSPFINSLLVLTPFSSVVGKLCERENRCSTSIRDEEDVQRKQQILMKESSWELTPLSTAILTSFGLLTLLLIIAWHFYEPPGIIDYILDLIPFIHRRRTYLQLFFDELIKILINIFGVSCKRFSYY